MNINRMIGPIGGAGILGSSIGSLLSDYFTVFNPNVVSLVFGIVSMILATIYMIKIERKEKTK